MKILNLIVFCLCFLAVYSCREKNEKPIDEAPESNASMIEDDNEAIPEDNSSSSSTATYTDNVDGTVNNDEHGTVTESMGKGIVSPPMFKALDMTDEQIKQYQTAGKKYQETVKNNRDIGNKAMMQQRDKNMKAVLSTSQYTKYKDMVKEYYSKTDSTETEEQKK